MEPPQFGLSPRVRGNPVRGAGPADIYRSIPACAGEPSRHRLESFLCRVYPRVCGGTDTCHNEGRAISGLSPRVRGNPESRRQARAAHGSIPACAGEPDFRADPRSRIKVYPRVCGGTIFASSRNSTSIGLSPRVRGNRFPWLLGHGWGGSIPACAGEPTEDTWPCQYCTVYPRVCGGTRAAVTAAAAASGLSPRVRGNPFFMWETDMLARSIPACAGEPIFLPFPMASLRVYPRVCGGTFFPPSPSVLIIGLSPRVRGNQAMRILMRPASRSIPACAGEPVRQVFSTCAISVYPRVCGGTQPRPAFDRAGAGLSPRVRGNRVWYRSQAAPARSIPACAGEPRCSYLRPSPIKVYPRVCGGTAAGEVHVVSLLGLSPRVRGNHSSVPITELQRRSIPACAGEPMTYPYPTA